MKSKTRIFLSMALFLLWSAGPGFSGPLEDCAEYAKLGVPGTEGDLLCRTGHLLAHSPQNKTPIWVVEHLTAEKAKGDPSIKRDTFRPDPDLKEGERAELSDYKGAGYDRGHMAPAADMKWDRKAMKECFYLSNMVPQNGPMNQKIWSALEGKVRGWAISRDDVYIITGPIYKGGVKRAIGPNKVAVPSHIYKIVYDPNTLEAIAFIMPNKPLEIADMAKYIVTIRDVEAATGLNFLSALKPDLQDIVETKKAFGVWKK